MWNSSIFLVLVVNYFSDEKMSKFIDFTNRFDKNYDSQEEFDNAFLNYNTNIEKISMMNDKYSHINFDVNAYTDVDETEFDKLKGFIINTDKTSSCESYQYEKFDTDETLDWREYNVVTPVKDQGFCGSCWSFSATGAMEGAWALHSGDLLELSEQQLIDCSVEYGDLACNGGLMDNAFEYAIDNNMCSEDSEPYLAEFESCEPCKSVANFTSCVDVTAGNELHLKAAVSKTPVSVAIDANSNTFQLYSGGVITPSECGTDLDHGVLLVGYGEEDGVKYWLLKNSWGDSWGENGYFKLERTDEENTDGTCGIALQPSYPVV